MSAGATSTGRALPTLAETAALATWLCLTFFFWIDISMWADDIRGWCPAPVRSLLFVVATWHATFIAYSIARGVGRSLSPRRD